jgi:preprotein translocase subunit YajC
MILAASPSRGGGADLSYLIIVVLIILFYLVIFRPQRRRQQRAQQMQSGVVPGSNIRTTAGIYGTVVSADDQDVVVQIAPGVEVRMLRRAVMDVIPDDNPPPPGGDDPEPHPDDTRSDDWDSPDRNA